MTGRQPIFKEAFGFIISFLGIYPIVIVSSEPAVDADNFYYPVLCSTTIECGVYVHFCSGYTCFGKALKVSFRDDT